MALTQSARLPGPSWDEEVVPALRKRLESESRTLARRISGISLSSANEVLQSPSLQPDTALNEKRESVASSSIPFQKSAAPKLHTPQPQQHISDRNILKTTAPRVNGSEPSSKLKFERKRTYSSPYASGLSNGQALPNGNTNTASKSTEPPRTSTSSRPSDVKPTRIPKAARGNSFSNGHSPHLNGQSHIPNPVTPPSQPQSPEIPNQPFPEQRSSEQRSPQRGVLPTPSSRTIVELPNQGIQLLNESPPFASISSTSSFSQHNHEPNQTQTEDPPRSSIDSEERPFEHWYRGEVSRNGGVGEFRVGRRQEMLDIANYGHAIKKKKKQATTRVQPIDLVDEPRRYRKRADSIGGMTDKEREERGSLYLDDEHASEVGRVLDESPLTDLDGEGSDVNSESEYYNGPYAYIPEVEDNPTPKPEPWTPTPETVEARSPTPISVPSSMIPQPSSRQQQPAPPTRIPTLSTSRRSSDSRRSATSPTPAPMTRGASEPPQLPSSSSSKTPPPSASSSSSKARQQTYTSNTLPTSTQKTAASPASKKSRTAASKATRAKASATRKEQQDEELNRKSVAYYPTPTGQGDDNMADAIPSWTQPVHGEGDWDEVILPVVARKKGLDGHYENADGSQKIKKVVKPIAPAPGTFGYDHSKYRPPRSDYEPIMDEFGQRSPTDQDESGQEEKPSDVLPPIKREVQKPSSISPTPRYDPRVAPFANSDSDKLPQHQQSQSEKVEDSGGCCKCIIM